MKRYQLSLRAGLFFTRGALRHEGSVCVVTLLIDTGSNYTIVSWDALASLGLDPASGVVRRSFMTANGLIQAPEVRIDDFHCSVSA